MYTSTYRGRGAVSNLGDAVGEAAPPRRANPIYHRLIFDPHSYNYDIILLHMRSSCCSGLRSCGARGATGQERWGSVEGFPWCALCSPRTRPCQNSLFNTSSLPTAVVKDVICLMRFDINRLPRLCACVCVCTKTRLTF